MTSSAPIAAIEREDVTPDRLRYEADAMHAAVNGEEYGDTFHWQNWNDKPHRVVFDAVDLLRGAAEQLDALARQAEEMKREIAELRGKLSGCDWYWPEDDTSSDACADGPWQIAENCDLDPGEVLAYSRGGVVETRYYAYLPPADDADSDDQFEVDAETELAVTQAIEAETARRARSLTKGESDAQG